MDSSSSKIPIFRKIRPPAYLLFTFFAPSIVVLSRPPAFGGEHALAGPSLFIPPRDEKNAKFLKFFCQFLPPFRTCTVEAGGAGGLHSIGKGVSASCARLTTTRFTDRKGPQSAQLTFNNREAHIMKIRLNPIVEGFTHKLGNLVFYERGDETFARRLGDYRDAKSPAQLAVRDAFSELASVWKSMSGLMQRSWKEFSRNRKSSGSGYNAFMGRNTRLQREGNPITLFQSMGEDRLEGFAASTGRLQAK
jgi:hypothetical protein